MLPVLVWVPRPHLLKTQTRHPHIVQSKGNNRTSGPHRPAHHNEVPHPGSLGHKCGDGAAARHEDDLDRVIVEQLVQVLGGLAWVTLSEEKGDKAGSARALFPL